MPELPDVETFRRYLDETSLRQTIERTSVLDERILQEATAQKLARRLKGRPLLESRRHGKYLFARAGDGGWLVLHFGMTGYLEYGGRDEPLPEHTRVEFVLTGEKRLAYVCQRMLGQVSFTEDWEEFVAQHELGPDALGLDTEVFRSRLEQKRSALKSALMDQNAIAGIGNVYSDEILFHHRLHPQTEPGQLTDEDWRSLHRTTQQVLEQAIEHRADPAGMPNSWLVPHRTESDPRCPACGDALNKKKVSGRTALFCPKCQKPDV